MLREELRDQDIPHRSTLRKRIEEIFDEHLIGLERQMSVSWPAQLIFVYNMSISNLCLHRRKLSEKSRLQWICGLILICLRSWRLRHIG